MTASTRHKLPRAIPGVHHLTVQRPPPVDEAAIREALLPLVVKHLAGKRVNQARANKLARLVLAEMKTNPVFALMRDWQPVVSLNPQSGMPSVFFTPPPDHEKLARH